MDYEKKYKELIEKIKSISHSALTVEQHQIIDTILGELKESEDERIRKSLIILLQHFCKGYRVPGLDFPVSYKDMLAWLEKQGEVESDNDDIEAEEKGIREAFNKIEDEKQDKQKSQRIISAEAKEAMYDKPADTIELKCEESKTKVFDAPTPFEDKLYAFVLACEILVDPSKREFILEHSQEILDAAREQIGKEQSSTWSKEDKLVVEDIEEAVINYWHGQSQEDLLDWLKALKQRYTWKPSDEQMSDLWNMLCECRPADHQLLQDIYYGLKKLRENNL